ncbi:LuxR C-terminal-related transcriptional regulator [Streptomyces sp. NPDC007027]|uniref:LuxR C-terminal-related transcriptional regulator n=1 Tax=Streptomyces sp. NPDC007027 TaxID=3157086 RepID=UPI0034517330
MPHTSCGSSREGAAAGAPTPNGDPVLFARFTVPLAPKTFVRRPRVTECLTEALAGPLVLVNGPAGAGKTLLVADWVATSPRPGPTAWLTVEAGDNAPGTFWSYLLGALRHHGLTVPDDVGTPARPDEVDPSFLSRLAAHLSRQPEPVILVLDEFERVSSPEIADELQFVLHHSGTGLRLVLISRTEPLLPLHRYRAAGEVTEIRAADLAFLPEETAELAVRHGLSLPDDGTRALTKRTRGWAAGLRLFVLAAQQAEDPDTFLKEFETGQSTIADFLLAEVLDAQPAESQDLLLRNSICERTHPGLANALTGRDDAAPILTELQDANAFVEHIGHSWYRLHPLFAEILRAHLNTRHPGLERQLHGTAARWLSDAGQLSEALPHAADAEDWEFAADRFVDDLAIGQLFTGLGADRLGALFARMAPETSCPASDLIRSACALARYDIDRGLEGLERAEAFLTEAGALNSSAAQLSSALLRIRAACLLGSAEMAETAARRAGRLNGREGLTERLEAHPEIPALMLAGLGSARLWAGRFEAARSALSEAAKAPGGPSTAVPRHESLGRLALIDFLRGWPGRAEALSREAISEAERSGLPAAARSSVGELVLAAVAIDHSDLIAARTHLHQAAVSAAGNRDPIVTSWLAIVRSRLLLARGEHEQALRVLDDMEEAPVAETPSPWVDTQVALSAAAVHMARGHPQAAVAALAEQRDAGPECATASACALLAAGDTEAALTLLGTLSSVNGRGPAVRVPALLVRAQAADALGDDASARRLVARALTAAGPERLRRPFLEAGPWLRKLLDHRPAPGQVAEWLSTGLSTVDSGEPARAPVLEPLSEREREVLGRLAQMMSTEEIAADLFLSVNTIKTHLRNIYRKLAVTRRGEAVRRAREAGLL